MNSTWAEENLRTIRTLMERSAVYRRALAPITLYVGLTGAFAAVIGLVFRLDSFQSFDELWFGTALIAIIGALLITRQHALKEREPFWSPPARRVVQALLPSWLAGLIATSIFRLVTLSAFKLAWWLPPLWMVLYGLGLCAAAFFMQRGIRLFGWFFFLSGLAISVILAIRSVSDSLPPFIYAHCLMGVFFGGGHLAYGVYLYLTEKGKNAA